MDEVARLEVSSLDLRHPGEALFDECAAKLVYRLSIDPTPLPTGVVERQVAVERRSPSQPDGPAEVACTVSWANLNVDLPDWCVRRRNTVCDENLTEWAAIGLMALLIHHLERLTITSVLPKGSGGDYELEVEGSGRAAQIEVSGVREDRTPTGSLTRARIAEKQDQILRTQSEGWVSVTTFARGPAGEVWSALHFVRRAPAAGET
jgi:hypothetical protein